jgi:geranylgeranyl diphosphate synthase type I
MKLSQAYATYLPWVEAEMQELLASPEPALARHYGMMQYHMGWLDAELRPTDAPVGKRLRPLLCLLACAAAGGDPGQAVPAAAGLELLHNFSLIHDDIEDDSPTRRHRPTVWKQFGISQALNAGDALFSLAHLALHRLAGRGVPASIALKVLHAFDETCVALTEGQFLDMLFEDRLDVTPAEYFRMTRGKTAALLAAAPYIGALIANATPDAVDAYRRFGAALGLAFQLQDDLLGIWGDEVLTGKSAAGDILSKKKTLPVVYALAHDQVGPELRRLYAGPPFTPADLPGILALLKAAGARAYVEAQVRQATAETHEALRAAKSYAAPEAHALLGELLDSLVGRHT